MDDVDHDCDGSVAIRRDIVQDFNSVSDLVLVRAVSSPSGGIKLSPNGTGMAATARLKGPRFFRSGVLNVTVKLSSLSGATCSIDVNRPVPLTQSFSGVGVPSCETGGTPCTHPGAFALQRKPRWNTASPIGWVDDWTLQRVSDPEMGQVSVQDLDLGPGAGDRFDPVRVLYTATAGGSWWDAAVTW